MCACSFNQKKWDNTIDWQEREKELIDLCDKHRKSNGEYDCIVGGSGGKDSVFQSHILKYKYKMNPLTVTWSPHLYTKVGWQNFQTGYILVVLIIIYLPLTEKFIGDLLGKLQ